MKFKNLILNNQKIQKLLCFFSIIYFLPLNSYANQSGIIWELIDESGDNSFEINWEKLDTNNIKQI